MKAALGRTLMFVAGLVLVAWGILPASSASVGAAPVFLATEASTNEPATPTTVPIPTSNPSATSIPTAVVLITPSIVPPTSTPAPTLTPVPTEPPPPDTRDRPTRTPEPTVTSVPATLTPEPPTPTVPLVPTVTPPLPADLAITKSVSPAKAKVGDSVTYTIIVTNKGGTTATGVVVEDTLPKAVKPIGVSTTKGDATVNGQTVRVNVGDLAPGESVTIKVQAKVVAPPVPPDNANLASVSSTSPDGNPANNRASVALNRAPVPAALPRTGEAGNELLPLATTLLGLSLIAVSLLLRRRSA